MKVNDIRRLHNLRNMLATRWWEPSLVIILFAAALGLLASLYQYTEWRSAARKASAERSIRAHPDTVATPNSDDPKTTSSNGLERLSAQQEIRLNKWMLFWFGLMILLIVLCFQIILFRIYNFRRFGDILMKMMEDLQKRQAEIENASVKTPSATRENQSDSSD